MKKSSSKNPPKTLSVEARAWWRRLVEDFELDDEPARLLLQTALESFDTMRAAQAILAKDGLILLDRFGQKRQHPASLIERDAKTAMARCLRQLNFDVEPPARLSGNR